MIVLNGKELFKVYNPWWNGSEPFDPTADDKKEKISFILNTVIYAITIIVVVMPEGLPLTVNMCLAFSFSEMAEFD